MEKLKEKIVFNIASAMENERMRYLAIPNYSSVAEGFDRKAIALSTLIYETDLCDNYEDYPSKRKYAENLLANLY